MNSRAKGKRGELEAAAILRDLGFANARRVGQAGLKGGKRTAADVVGIPGLHLEVKLGKLPDMRRALKQATGDAEGTGDVPIALTRSTKRKRDKAGNFAESDPWLVALDAAEFFDIYYRLLLETGDLPKGD